MRRWVAAVAQRLRDFDAVLMPTVPIVALRIADVGVDEEAHTSANLLVLRNPTLMNLLDGCALTLPCHRAGDAPVGVMVSGTNGPDGHILALGAAIEQLLAAD